MGQQDENKSCYYLLIGMVVGQEALNAKNQGLFLLYQNVITIACKSD